MEKTPENLLTAGAVVGVIISKVGNLLLRDSTGLRRDIQRLNEKIDVVSTELDLWKGKYYALTEENIKLRAECRDLRSELGSLAASLHKP